VIRRAALALAIVTGVSVTAGAAAVLPIGESARMQVIETEPPVRPGPHSTTTVPGDADRGPKLWVCVVLAVGNGDGWKLKPGANPIEVAAVSQVARDAEDPDHPSYLASSGDERCALPLG
jgi:hypothetical protein